MGRFWSTERLDILCEKIVDCPHSTPLWTNYGVIVIRNQNIKNGRLDLTSPSYTNEANYEARSRRARLQENDVVITREAPMGEVCIIPKGLKCCLGQRMVLLRANQKVCDPFFLLYALQSPLVQNEILVNEGTGSTVSNLRIPLLESLQIPNPPLNIQKKISGILKVIDGKIELNRQMNATLEAMARALFQSWFVDFDLNRKKVKEFEKEKILEIGDGYRAKNEEIGGEGIPFIRAANLKAGIETQNAERLRQESISKVGNKISKPGDVAFTSKGTIGRFARVSEKTDKFVYSPQVCFWRSLEPNILHPAVLFCWMQTEDFLGQVNSVSGQTDMAPYVSLRDQREMTVPIFPESQNEIGNILESILSKQSSNELESQALSTLRDALLPKLLSGEISVSSEEGKRAVNA